MIRLVSGILAFKRVYNEAKKWNDLHADFIVNPMAQNPLTVEPFNVDKVFAVVGRTDGEFEMAWIP